MNFKKITLINILFWAILACSFTATGNPSPADPEFENDLLPEEEPSGLLPPATPENNSGLDPIFGENLLTDTGFQTVVPHEDVTINNAGNIIALPTQSGVEFFDLLLQEPIELDLEGFPPDPIRAWETRWSHDGSMLASLISGDIYIWETSTGSQLMRSEAPQAYHLAWSPNDSQLATADVAQRGIVIWDVNTGEAIWESAEYYHRTSHIAWSPNGDFLVQQGGGQFYVWVAETFEIITTLGKKAGPTILFMDWAPDNTLVYFNFTDSTLTFVNSTNWETTIMPITSDNYGPRMALAPDGTKFAFGLADGTIEIRRYHDLEVVEVFGMHSKYISQIVWLPDSQSLISLSLYDKQTRPIVGTEIMMWQLGE